MRLVEINRNPSARDLKWFGLMLALFLDAVGAIFFWRFDKPEVAWPLWIAAVVLPAIYYLVPALRRPMYVGWMFLAFPLAWTISHVLLGIVYYLVLTPIGLVMRLVGRDPMHRKPDRSAETYWIPHARRDTRSYFRQF